MAATSFRGPAVALGSLLDGRVEAMDGPGIEYQGDCIPDPRFQPSNLMTFAPAIPAHLNSPYIVMTDNFPQAFSGNAIAALANAVTGTAMTLTTVTVTGASTKPSMVTGVPLIPFGKTSSSLVNVIALDFGFTTGATTLGNTIIVVPDSTLFTLGQWIVVGGAGNAGKTLSLVTQVTALTDATHIVVANAPAASFANIPIGNANAYAISQGAANAANPAIGIGAAQVWNPIEAIARCLSVTGVASGTGGVFRCVGYDYFGQQMSEDITAGSGISTVYGKKAFKYVQSVTPQFSDAHNYSIGFGDTFGFHIRSDKWEYMNLFYNGAFISSSTGWTVADTTTPATRTTGDVRGTVQVSANGAGTPISGGASTTGSLRIALFMSVPAQNLFNANATSAVSLYGVTQNGP